MRITVVTLFSEFFEAPLSTGLVGKALAAGRAEVTTVDPRAFTHDRHRTVDDTPYGGGGGMVMKPEPMVAAIRQARRGGRGPVVLLSPQGRPLTQSDFQRWSTGAHLVLVAGRYEGYDERIRRQVDDEVSLGDFVLTGGEYGALAIIDGVVRLLPGTLGNRDCPEHDSFSDGLLEYPHYTRPAEFEGDPVPEVLQSGHHGKLTEWRHAQALLRTRARRPDLLRRRGVSPAEAAVLTAVGSPPTLVALPAERLTADILAIAAAYDVAQVFAVATDAAAAEAVRRLADRLRDVRSPRRSDARPRKLRRAPVPAIEVDLGARVSMVHGWDGLPASWEGRAVRRVAADRLAPADAEYDDPVAYAPRRPSDPVPCLMAEAPPGIAERYLPILRSGTASNRLPLAAVLGIYLDRLVGEG